MRRATLTAIPDRRFLTLGLAVCLLLASSLVALRGVAMLASSGGIEAHAASSAHDDHSGHDPSGHSGQKPAAPKAHDHLEHCQLCFSLLVQVPGLDEALAAHVRVSHVGRLWLSAAQARDEFLRSVAARAPPKASTVVR